VSEFTHPSIFIYCDYPGHAKHVAITNFQQIDPEDSTSSMAGRWNEVYTSTAAQGGRESGATLIGDRLAGSDDLVPGGRIEGVRSRYAFPCRKCRRSVTAREPEFFSALNKLADAGVAAASLTLLAATLRLIDV
jgi:hypothetical protein